MHETIRPAVSSVLLLFATSGITPLNHEDPEITPRAEEAIRKGLKWLQSNQNREGSWG